MIMTLFSCTHPVQRILIITLLSGVLTSCGALPGNNELEDQTVLTNVSVNSDQMLAMVNNYRQQNSMPSLQFDQRLNDVSQDMAQHIAKRDSMDTWAHSAFGLSQRLDKAGYPNYAGAENLGAGYANLTTAFRGWQGSEGHNKNLLNPYVTRVGIARTNRNTGKWRNFWVMTLARPLTDGRPTQVR
ncbi:MAG: CAP domain-containing protein [Roseibium sp.]